MSLQPSSDEYPAATTTRPWSEFFDISALSFPVSLSDATTRFNSNLTHFRLNYINVFLIIFFLTLALRPLSLLLVFVVSLSWYFLYFNPRILPLEIAGFIVDDRIVFGILAVISIIALFVAHSWMNLMVAILISAVIVGLHGVLRVPSFGDQDPYGGLLDAEAGAYNEF
ncbi:PRA1 family protein D-like [Amaranthus tricolor]|uniref:PRA1 family protein D-like n=1 Tax=Amaranthus tricolor TaxID=29722 RepID=UPI0025896427|nr:PRA1 family protein D-like [Amaranthus tricolor]